MLTLILVSPAIPPSEGPTVRLSVVPQEPATPREPERCVQLKDTPAEAPSRSTVRKSLESGFATGEASVKNPAWIRNRLLKR